MLLVKMTVDHSRNFSLQYKQCTIDLSDKDIAKRTWESLRITTSKF